MSPHAWIIDNDWLGGQHSEIGWYGPVHADVPADQAAAIPSAGYEKAKAALNANYQHHHQFRLYDDDDILYVTGTLYWNGEPQPDEAACYAPLGDYGMPALGAVSVRYTGKPAWDCG